MNENKKVFTMNYGGKEISVETGRLAKQADGAVLVTAGKTQVLVTVCSAHKMKDGQDFFPLTVDYTEKFWAAGKFLGGFMKREGRPTTGETLNARLIDRPLRPLFPNGYMFETVVQATVMSYDPENDPEVCAALGAAAAIAVSDIPFNGPLGTCKVGLIDGELVLNPGTADWENSELELVVSATKTAIMMVEGEGNEIKEEKMIEALNFAHDNIKGFCDLLDDMTKECGKPKRKFESALPNTKLVDEIKSQFGSDVRAALNTDDKLERQTAVRLLEGSVKDAIKATPASFGLEDGCDAGKEAYKGVDEVIYHMMRHDILKEGKRIGNRPTDKVRAIETEVDVLATPHGSALFTRGETQVLAAVTLGGGAGEQMVDSIYGLSYNNFYLHYAMPPFAVADARAPRGVSRREQGHGNLAERAVKKMVDRENCPYTIRIACEVLESNGSSSMGSVCSASMALMAAGIEMIAPVAGVAMGLIKEGDDFVILTDILGDEDHLGDMDFKIAGSEKGITAIQMDIKIEGISMDITTKALKQAYDGRVHILGEMAKTINTTKGDMRDNVPKMRSMTIPADKIGMLIGPGGKNIKAIQADFEISVEVEDSGNVKLIGTDTAKLESVESLIHLQLNGPKIGTDYAGTAVTVKEYGAFVDIAPGVSGLLHVSEFGCEERVNDPKEYIAEGDTVTVTVLDVDRFGKIKLTAKSNPLKKK